MTPERQPDQPTAASRPPAAPPPAAAGDTLHIGPDTLVAGGSAVGPGVSDDALELLRAAARPDGTGCILLAVARNFGSCAAGGRQFVPDHTRAAAARWEAAVAELVKAGLVAPPAERGCLYRVRSAGYDLVARLG